MKPLKLTMSAFATFAGEQVIDFTKLNGRNIFLVTGKTGAGKTTIFDAISYALYGSPSGDFRDVASLRSDYADGSVKTYVELEFELRGKVYKINRNPEQMLNKLKGEGLKKELAGVSFYIPDEEKPLTRIKDVDERVKEILGVDKDQFRQIVMLPQGEFIKLLKASSADREKIFRKIFGTESFNKVQDNLTNKAKKLGAELKTSKSERNIYVKQIKADEDSVLNSIIKNEDVDIDNVKEITKELIAEDKKLALELSAEQDKKGLEIKELEDNQRSLEQSKKIIIEFKKNENDFKLHKDKENVVKDYERQLLEGRKAEKVKVVHDKLIAAEENSVKREGAYINALTNEKEVIIKYNNCKAEFEKEKDKSKEREELTLEIEELKKKELIVSDYDTKKNEVENLKKEKKSLSAEIEKIELIIKQEKEDKKKISDYIKEFEDIKEQVQTSEFEGKNLNADFKKLKDISNAYSTLRYKNIDHKEKSTSFEEFDQKYKAIKKNYEDKEELFKRGQAGILAQLLSEGVACPVCGSENHPKKAIKQDNVPSEEELKKLKNSLDKETEKRDKLFSELTVLNSEMKNYYENTIKVLASEVKDLLGDDFFKKDITEQTILLEEKLMQISDALEKKRAEYKSLKKVLDIVEVKKKELEDLEKKFEKNNELITLKNQSFNELDKNLVLKVQQLEHIENEVPQEMRNKEVIIKRKNEMISNLALLNKSYEDAEKAFRISSDENSTSKNNTKNSFDELEKSKTELKKLKLDFDTILQEQGFCNFISYKESLSNLDLDRLEEKIKNYSNELSRLDALYQKSKEEFDNLKIKDNTILENELEQIKLKIREFSLEFKVLTEKINSFKNRANHNKDSLAKINAVTEKIKDKEEIYKDVAHLSSVANGDKGNEKKVSFESYILTSYFDEIILRANQRLDKMSNGRFNLKRKESEGKGNGRKGLELEVFDNNTGSLRGVNSLSGGESFKSALSLALGLADVIQSYAGGISIDTMFIDEGFGTLDPESLDNAIECLLNLQQGGRIVGIISHVLELKERIDARLEVTPSEKEGSKAEFIIR